MGGTGVAAMGLCLVDRKGEEVVPLRPRYIIKAHSLEEDVSLHCTLSCFTLYFFALFFTPFPDRLFRITPRCKAVLIVILK